MSSENANGPMILCWDGSDGAEQAIRHAAGLAGAGRPGIVLFAFVPTESARGVLGGLSGPDAPIMSAPEAEVYSNEESVWRARPASRLNRYWLTPNTRPRASLSASPRNMTLR